MEETIVEIRDSASAYVNPHWGKFFYLREVRKIYSTLHTRAKIFHFRAEIWKNSRSHLNGPREEVSPNIDRNGPREGVSSNIGRNGPRGGVSSNIDRNGPRGGVSPNIGRNGPREGVRPKSC
jgi:hypothetical protein